MSDKEKVLYTWKKADQTGDLFPIRALDHARGTIVEVQSSNPHAVMSGRARAVAWDTRTIPELGVDPNGGIEAIGGMFPVDAETGKPRVNTLTADTDMKNVNWIRRFQFSKGL